VAGGFESRSKGSKGGIKDRGSVGFMHRCCGITSRRLSRALCARPFFYVPSAIDRGLRDGQKDSFGHRSGADRRQPQHLRLRNWRLSVGPRPPCSVGSRRRSATVPPSACQELCAPCLSGSRSRRDGRRDAPPTTAAAITPGRHSSRCGRRSLTVAAVGVTDEQTRPKMLKPGPPLSERLARNCRCCSSHGSARPMSLHRAA
jgi:hypothetical protein